MIAQCGYYITTFPPPTKTKRLKKILLEEKNKS
jgi:hypothetical protein